MERRYTPDSMGQLINEMHAIASRCSCVKKPMPGLGSYEEMHQAVTDYQEIQNCLRKGDEESAYFKLVSLAKITTRDMSAFHPYVGILFQRLNSLREGLRRGDEKLVKESQQTIEKHLPFVKSGLENMLPKLEINKN